MKRIASRSNPTFRSIRLLANSATERHTQMRTVLDGPHLVSSYIDRCGAPRLIAVSETACEHPGVRSSLEHAGACEVVHFSADLFRQLTPVENPVGILAVIDIPQGRPAGARGQLAVMLDGIQDPGNVGTIIRSAAAAGTDEVLLSPGCADAWAPRTLRAGMGAHFAVSIQTGMDLLDAILRFSGIRVATVAVRGLSPQAVDLRGRVALLLGAEGAGLSEALERAADVRVCIPMARGIESLNVGAAAAVVLFERVRQLAVTQVRARSHP
jgi:TrmH family RNA methyltransferase